MLCPCLAKASNRGWPARRRPVDEEDFSTGYCPSFTLHLMRSPHDAFLRSSGRPRGSRNSEDAAAIVAVGKIEPFPVCRLAGPRAFAPGDLRALATRKVLLPDLRFTGTIQGEIHRLAIGRPAGVFRRCNLFGWGMVSILGNANLMLQEPHRAARPSMNALRRK